MGFASKLAKLTLDPLSLPKFSGSAFSTKIHWIRIAVSIAKGGRTGVRYGSLGEKVEEGESGQPMLPGTSPTGDQATKEREHSLSYTTEFFRIRRLR